jgi:hypothetical protein
MFCAPQTIWKTPDQVLVQKILQKMFIGTDKLSEIVNHSDSDSSGFSEISDSDTCMVKYILITRNKTFLFDNQTHKRGTQVISAGLLESVSIRRFCSNVSG